MSCKGTFLTVRMISNWFKIVSPCTLYMTCPLWRLLGAPAYLLEEFASGEMVGFIGPEEPTAPDAWLCTTLISVVLKLLYAHNVRIQVLLSVTIAGGNAFGS